MRSTVQAADRARPLRSPPNQSSGKPVRLTSKRRLDVSRWTAPHVGAGVCLRQHDTRRDGRETRHGLLNHRSLRHGWHRPIRAHRGARRTADGRSCPQRGAWPKAASTRFDQPPSTPMSEGRRTDPNARMAPSGIQSVFRRVRCTRNCRAVQSCLDRCSRRRHRSIDLYLTPRGSHRSSEACRHSAAEAIYSALFHLTSRLNVASKTGSSASSLTYTAIFCLSL